MTKEEFRTASQYWEVREKTAIQAEKEYILEKIDEYIKAHNTCALATACEGFVRCTPIEYLWKDGYFWLYSEGGLKFKALEVNKDVALSIFDAYSGFGNVHGMQVTGTAEIVDEDSQLYDEMLSFHHISKAALQKAGHCLHLIKVVPSRIDFLSTDFKKDGFDTRQHVEF